MSSTKVIRALTNATLSYGLEIADLGVLKSINENPALARGLNTYQGKVTHVGVSTAMGIGLTTVEEVIGG